MNEKLDNHITVPMADLYLQYFSIKDEIDNAFTSVIRESAYIRGSFVEEFEKQFAEKIGSTDCISCANGTDALYIAMRALEVMPGDEIITTAHSWIATSETITQAGGTVVFCDTDIATFNIDPKKIEEKITSRTVGIIPVHLCGQAADMDRIMAIAARHNLWVIEDCAQAHLAKHNGRTVGTFGNVGTFSFYPGKNLGGMGDGGAITTSDKALAKRMAIFARHGGLTKGEHLIEGINSRLDGLQAAVLSVKLRYLEKWNSLRRGIADIYRTQLQGIPGFHLPTSSAEKETVWHLYMVRTNVRDELAIYLKDSGIQTSINYRTALPFLPAYKRFSHLPTDFPSAYKCQNEILSLPIFPEMNELQISMVVKSIRSFYELQNDHVNDYY